MGWYKDINAILEYEPEIWLAYIYGQQLENIPHLTRNKPRSRGALPQLVKYFFHLWQHLRIRPIATPGASIEFLAFAGTTNQLASMSTTIDSLRQGGVNVVALVPKRIMSRKENNYKYLPYTYSVTDVYRAILLLLRRGPSLYRQLKSHHPVALDWYFSDFCSVYGYLCGFYRIMKQQRPEFVITSNDHNAPNRCMLAVAHSLGIKTVYLQHASVSNLFPALRVNYAFLDGQSAFNTYLQCEENKASSISNAPLPMVLLTGQKKHLVRSEGNYARKVGVALNALDDPNEAIKLAKTLAAAGKNVLLRWHPGQADRDTKRYLTAFSNYPGISLSNPNNYSVSDFMGEISHLIAGNSSIHLEAALAGVTPIYYELTPSDIPDYYGYVKQGLAKSAASPVEILKLLSGSASSSQPDVNAVRFYSSTYLTEWDGREGELVAMCLMALIKGESLPLRADAINSMHRNKAGTKQGKFDR